MRKRKPARIMDRRRRTPRSIRQTIFGETIKNIQPVEGGREEIDEALEHMSEHEAEEQRKRSRRRAA